MGIRIINFVRQTFSDVWWAETVGVSMLFNKFLEIIVEEEKKTIGFKLIFKNSKNDTSNLSIIKKEPKNAENMRRSQTIRNFQNRS